jgi:hypothetical protein
MMWRARMERSRTLMRCSGSGRPVALRKVALTAPSSRARAVMRCAKASSFPASASAMTMQASLADCTTAPLIRSSSRIEDLTSAYMVEPPETAPPRRQASSLTVNCWSSVIVPAFSASKTMIMVIILLMEAGGTGTSASFSKSTRPVRASIRIACGALVEYSSCAWAGAAATSNTDNQASRPAPSRRRVHMNSLMHAKLGGFDREINDWGAGRD